MSHYANYIKYSTRLNIVKIDETEYSVRFKTENLIYTVNVNFVTCDCPFGRGGRYCKQMCAVG